MIQTGDFTNVMWDTDDGDNNVVQVSTWVSGPEAAEIMPPERQLVCSMMGQHYSNCAVQEIFFKNN